MWSRKDSNAVSSHDVPDQESSLYFARLVQTPRCALQPLLQCNKLPQDLMAKKREKRVWILLIMDLDRAQRSWTVPLSSCLGPQVRVMH